MKEIQEGILCGFCGGSILPNTKSFNDNYVCQKCQRQYFLIDNQLFCSCCFSSIYYIKRKFGLSDAVVCSNPDCSLYKPINNKLMYKDIEVLRIVDTQRGEKIVSAMPDTAFEDFCIKIRKKFILFLL